jgi:glucose-6-phosphate 1-dehydrogenase
MDAWKSQNLSNLPVYEAGTQGPHGADDFIKDDGCYWRTV